MKKKAERRSAKSSRKLKVLVQVPLLSAPQSLGTVDFLIARPGKPDSIQVFSVFRLIVLADL
jgi:hypothetical protein